MKRTPGIELEHLLHLHHHNFYSGGRCLRCAIKEGYMGEALTNLVRWPRNEKTENWMDQVAGYLSCPAMGAHGYISPDVGILERVKALYDAKQVDKQ